MIEPNQIPKNTNKKPIENRMKAIRKPKFHFQMDLGYMDKITKFNYILFIIDTTSRYLYMYPFNKKSA